MNKPEKTVPLPEWYGSRALPALKKDVARLPCQESGGGCPTVGIL